MNPAASIISRIKDAIAGKPVSASQFNLVRAALQCFDFSGPNMTVNDGVGVSFRAEAKLVEVIPVIVTGPPLLQTDPVGQNRVLTYAYPWREAMPSPDMLWDTVLPGGRSSYVGVNGYANPALAGSPLIVVLSQSVIDNYGSLAIPLYIWARGRQVMYRLYDRAAQKMQITANSLIATNRWRYTAQVAGTWNPATERLNNFTPGGGSFTIYNQAEFHNDGSGQEGSGETYTGTQIMLPIMNNRFVNVESIGGIPMFDIPNSPQC